MDANGKVRAQFNTEETGEVVLRLRGPDGTIRTKFAAGNNGAGLVLMDERTEATVQIRANKDGGGISLFDAMEKQIGIKMEIQKRPMPVLVIDHIDQKPTDN